MSVRQHDMHVLACRMQQMGMHTMIVAAIHCTFGAAQPLLLMPFMGLCLLVSGEPLQA